MDQMFTVLPLDTRKRYAKEVQGNVENINNTCFATIRGLFIRPCFGRLKRLSLQESGVIFFPAQAQCKYTQRELELQNLVLHSSFFSPVYATKDLDEIYSSGLVMDTTYSSLTVYMALQFFRNATKSSFLTVFNTLMDGVVGITTEEAFLLSTLLTPIPYQKKPFKILRCQPSDNGLFNGQENFLYCKNSVFGGKFVDREKQKDWAGGPSPIYSYFRSEPTSIRKGSVIMAHHSCRETVVMPTPYGNESFVAIYVDTMSEKFLPLIRK